MALPIGTRVRVLPPFDVSFPGEHVTRAVTVDDCAEEPAPDVNWIVNVPGGFDDDHLEVL